MRVRLALVALALLLAPTAAAEFGPESEDGWPINAEGKVLRPPVIPVVATQVPADVAAAYAALGADADAADPLNKIGPFTAYPYYPVLTAELQRLAADHPDLVKLSSVGKSTAGLDLWMLEIADFARIESGEALPLEAREVVWLDGGHHSNEYSGVYFITEWAQFLLDEYATNETAKWIVENRHTFIVPMVNPDGSHLFGRLNAKGVNINRNYPVGWAGLDEDPVFNNPGPSAASEPETKALMAAWETIRPDYVGSIHCCGNLWLYPYGIEGVIALDEEPFARICDLAFPDVREDCGPIWSTIYPASGSSVDTAYEQVGAAAFGFEMSGRANLAGPWGEPFTRNDVREQERESWSGVLHAFLHVEKYGAHPRIVAVEGDAARLRITIENDGYGNLTAGNLTLVPNGACAGIDAMLCDPAFAQAALPFLAPEARAVVEVEGAFVAGDQRIAFDYVKRAMAAPEGAATIALPLQQEGARLFAVLDDAAQVDLAGADARVPSAGVPLAAAAALGVALALRRRA